MLPFEVKKWFIVRGSARRGPFSIVELQEMITRTELGPSDFMWCEGMTVAKLMIQIEELKFLAEHPSMIRRGAAPQPGLKEEVEQTMIAGAKFVRQLGAQASKPPAPPSDDPDNEPTQIMTRSQRSPLPRSAKPPASPVPPTPRAEPEDVRSLELASSATPPPRAAPPQAAPPHAVPPRAIPTPPALPRAQPKPAPEPTPPPTPEPEPEPEQEAPPENEPPAETFESLEEKPAEAEAAPSITFTNPFVKTGTGTYKKKKMKKIPLQWVVLATAGALVVLVFVFFYQMARTPGTASRDVSELTTTSYDIASVVADTLPEEHAELVFAHGARLTLETIKVAVARSTDAGGTLKFYLATNLPPKTRLIISLEPFRGSSGSLFIRRVEVESSRLTNVDSGIPVKKIHPGEYYFFAVEDTEQPAESQLWFERMRTTPRRIPSVKELKKLVVSKRYTF